MKQNAAEYGYTVTEKNISSSFRERSEVKAADYLRRVYNYSSRVLKTVKYDGGFTVNGKEVFLNTPVKAGDVLKVCLKPESADCEAEDIPVSIIFENDDIAVVNKPPYMLTHPTKNVSDGTLANALYYRWQTEGFYGKAHFVSRLDMNTSGIITVAKNKYIHHFLQDYLSKNVRSKYYLALVCGKPEKERGVIQTPISYSGDGIRMQASDEGNDARDATTEYELVATNGEYSLMKMCLVTGRTHQLRVHLAHIGCPVAGDTLYNPENTLLARQALHAYEVSLPEPTTGILHTYRAPLFEDMKELIELYFKDIAF